MNQFIKKLQKFYWIVLGENSNKVLVGIVRNQSIILAAFLWRRLLVQTTFIAVAGSVGKTTTKEFLANILEQKYRVMSTLGNHNSRKFKGLEMTILRTRPWHKYAVVEVGMSTHGVMESSAKFLKPDIVIMLDIKRCHTNEFKTLEALTEEKSQLLKYLDDNGCAILNQDSSFIANMSIKPKVKVIRFGCSEVCDLQLLSAESNWPERLTLTIALDGVIYDIKTRLVGTHWTTIIMASLATARHCGISITDAIKAIQLIEPFWARMQPIMLPSIGATILRDDFNGSIDTYEAALKAFNEATALRKIVVFSDYSDSNRSLRTRANRLGRMAANCADIAVFVGDYADRSAKSAITAGMNDKNVFDFIVLSAATEFLKHELMRGDLVLIKGKASQHMSRIYLGLIGKVTCEVPICPKRFLCDRCPELGFKWSPELQGYLATPDSNV